MIHVVKMSNLFFAYKKMAIWFVNEMFEIPILFMKKCITSHWNFHRVVNPLLDWFFF